MLRAAALSVSGHCEERCLRLRQHPSGRSNLPHVGDCFAPSGEKRAGLRSQ
jgi:hypothetical protein